MSAAALWVGTYWCMATALSCGGAHAVQDEFLRTIYFLSEQSCLAEAKRRADAAFATPEWSAWEWRYGCTAQQAGRAVAGVVRP